MTSPRASRTPTLRAAPAESRMGESWTTVRGKRSRTSSADRSPPDVTTRTSKGSSHVCSRRERTDCTMVRSLR